eukprot:1159815-Pelagomonas_calceolata.AAC.8
MHIVHPQHAAWRHSAAYRGHRTASQYPAPVCFTRAANRESSLPSITGTCKFCIKRFLCCCRATRLGCVQCTSAGGSMGGTHSSSTTRHTHYPRVHSTAEHDLSVLRETASLSTSSAGELELDGEVP